MKNNRVAVLKDFHSFMEPEEIKRYVPDTDYGHVALVEIDDDFQVSRIHGSEESEQTCAYIIADTITGDHLYIAYGISSINNAIDFIDEFKAIFSDDERMSFHRFAEQWFRSAKYYEMQDKFGMSC